MEAYCVKCKAKREIQDPNAIYTSTGAPATSGLCQVCGTKLFRMGRTEAHDGLTPPVIEKKTPKRSGRLVIVESPAKASTIERYLGKGYTVKASVGHVRDLLKSQLSVDVEQNFEPKYRVPNEKRNVVKDIKKLAAKAEAIYLATDPDREGEAIAWHLLEAAEMDPALTQRVVFNEITKPAVTAAFEHPRSIDMNLVDAQQARRVLDRLVGYSISPILWRKVRGRLSAGRVQSVAVRLVVDREREIEVFVPEEYWTIEAELKPASSRRKADHYKAKLVRVDGEEPVLDKESLVTPILVDLETAAYIVRSIKKGERQRRPAAPFTTSTLQQEASRRLGFTTRRTMTIAQQLYEGIAVGENGGSTGLITYMRTDSTTVSKLAQDEARSYINEQHGATFLPETPPVYKTRAQSAQEAHEAIRPTSVLRNPEEIKGHLLRDQYRLYQLIWQRFLSSQMANAIYDTVTAEIEGKTKLHEYLLRASGSTLRFPGFLVVYEESKDEDQAGENGNNRLPDMLEENQVQDLVKLLPEQHFTQPPPRYTEASLVRTLEENGIGRPSTYAPIIATIQQRGYVTRDTKRLFPTETGVIVTDLVAKYFPNIIDVNFTASMEDLLDQIATGDGQWKKVLGEFYVPFSEQLTVANKEMPEVKVDLESAGRPCPLCGRDLVIRWGRYGRFISCSGFPDCRHTEPLLESIGVQCPKDQGELVQRRSKKGRVFYGCANYPECDFVSWKLPLATPCPACSGLLVQLNKRQAQCSKCQEVFEAEELGISLNEG